MIAPKVNFDLAMKEQPPPIVKKPVSFFNNDKQAPAPTPTPVKQQAPPAPAHAHAPAHANAHAQEADDITTELEEMSIGLQGLMEGSIKPIKPKRKLTPAQIAHLAKMREMKALKREEAKKTKLVLQQAPSPSPSPSPQQPSSNLPNQPQSYENLNDIITKEFEKLYSAKESIRQREKAIRNETKQKMLAKLMAQQKLQAPAPAPQPAPTPAPAPQAPKPIESTVGKKLRYKMSPFGGIDTYYE
jgi:hypothetical protein